MNREYGQKQRMRDRRELRLTVRNDKTIKHSYLRHHFVSVFQFVFDLYSIGHGIDRTHAAAVVFIPNVIYIDTSETEAFFSRDALFFPVNRYRNNIMHLIR